MSAPFQNPPAEDAVDDNGFTTYAPKCVPGSISAVWLGECLRSSEGTGAVAAVCERRILESTISALIERRYSLVAPAFLPVQACTGKRVCQRILPSGWQKPTYVKIFLPTGWQMLNLTLDNIVNV